jgi:hypothetical protein
MVVGKYDPGRGTARQNFYQVFGLLKFSIRKFGLRRIMAEVFIKLLCGWYQNDIIEACLIQLGMLTDNG